MEAASRMKAGSEAGSRVPGMGYQSYETEIRQVGAGRGGMASFRIESARGRGKGAFGIRQAMKRPTSLLLLFALSPAALFVSCGDGGNQAARQPVKIDRYNEVADFRFTNQEDREVSRAELEGKTGDIYVKDSSVQFLRPILSDMKATASLACPPGTTLRGNLAFEVEMTVLDSDGKLCGRGTASYRLLAKAG